MWELTLERNPLNVVNVGRPSATVHPSLTIKRCTPEFRRWRKALCKFAHFRQFRWTHTGKVPFLLNITIQGSLLAREISYSVSEEKHYHLCESFLWQVIWRVILEIDTGYSFILHLRIHKGDSVVVMHLGKMSATVLPMFITNPSQEHLERCRRERKEKYTCVFFPISLPTLWQFVICVRTGEGLKGERSKASSPLCIFLYP